MFDKANADARNQADKFKDAARDLQCDEDEARWEDRLKRVAKQKPEHDRR